MGQPAPVQLLLAIISLQLPGVASGHVAKAKEPDPHEQPERG
eukprot:CAMPEP_0195105550 /NCGR_PEP_ID=MMETSP0448-20130528/76829_1 /TAXON_ID=66468 /ORGANISM="Heterocapsa triquestra, Strain CCMP 448" /LENGTH=41 /DNA_ID= /DNA_START= /DNA_END= /DNA_ORIENTATION=